MPKAANHTHILRTEILQLACTTGSIFLIWWLKVTYVLFFFPCHITMAMIIRQQLPKGLNLWSLSNEAFLNLHKFMHKKWCYSEVDFNKIWYFGPWRSDWAVWRQNRIQNDISGPISLSKHNYKPGNVKPLKGFKWVKVKGRHIFLWAVCIFLWYSQLLVGEEMFK